MIERPYTIHRYSPCPSFPFLFGFTYLRSRPMLPGNDPTTIMKTRADKTHERQSKAVAHDVAPKQRRNASDVQFVDNRPEAAAQRRLQAMVDNSPQVKQLKALQALMNQGTQRSKAQAPGSKQGAGAKGAEPVQRMLSVNDTDLYYTKSTLGLVGDRGKNQEVKEAEWETNIGGAMSLNPIDITGDNFLGKFKMTGWSGNIKGLIKTQLAKNAEVFGYSQWYGLDDESHFTESEGIKVLQPKDWLDESSDITGQYDEDLACVLQALINQGASVPSFSGIEGANDYVKFHKWMRQNGYESYDLDYVVYKYYTSIGLTLVVNQVTPWKDLQLAPGKYVFTKQGHSFAVTVEANHNAPADWTVNDEPQNFTT